MNITRETFCYCLICLEHWSFSIKRHSKGTKSDKSSGGDTLYRTKQPYKEAKTTGHGDALLAVATAVQSATLDDLIGI